MIDGKSFALVVLMGAIGVLVGWTAGTQQPSNGGIPARTVADYLHAVIEADRTFYTQHVVERMEAMLIVTASENWGEEKTLPLPVQFLREASHSLHTRGAPFRYRLISLWPLNTRNAPTSDLERAALEQVVEYGEVVEEEIMIDEHRYFQAIYPDRAVSRACVSCHNAHPESPKRDFKLNDVMGGIVIHVPLG
ncbi:MAG: DUF3365 domain-containing protein [Nitrospirae bacterium]|nr:DUF3365 domain-containing protein [Nitrospirota bacterium]